MRRYHSKADANQPEIVEAIRKLGGTVLHLHTLGHGAPDLAVGYGGLTMLAEIKDGSKPPSAQKLTPDEEKWHGSWTGGVYLIRDIEDAARMLDTMRRWASALREVDLS